MSVLDRFTSEAKEQALRELAVSVLKMGSGVYSALRTQLEEEGNDPETARLIVTELRDLLIERLAV